MTPLVLRDVHEGIAPAWWPLAPGWWMVLGAMVIIAAVMSAVCVALRPKASRRNGAIGPRSTQAMKLMSK